jgi:glycosyltransferase involved in cell wall biosynthesis
MGSNDHGEMKVVHVIIGLGVGGAETMLKKLVLSASGVTHVVVSLTSCGPIGQQLVEKKIKVYALDMRDSVGVPWAAWRLLRILRSERPSAVQTWMYHADLLGGVVASVLGIPVVWGVRTTELPRARSIAARFIRKCCALLSNAVPDKIVYPAVASKKLHERIGYSRHKSIVIPNGFQVDTLLDSYLMRGEMRKIFGLQDLDVAVGFVGRFHDDKDPHTFLRAMSFLLNRVSLLKVILVGRDFDVGNHRLSAWIDGCGLRGRVLLLGERFDVPACVSAMDVFCLSSRTEGFPNVLGEAMGVGVPCVATDVGDVREVLGDCGIVVPREDPSALAEGVRNILGWTPEERTSRVACGRERIAVSYSIAASCRKFENLYRNIARNGEDQCAV